MTNKFEIAFTELCAFEFTGAQNALHTPKPKIGLSFMCIKQKEYPNWIGWNFIESKLQNNKNFNEVSEIVYNNSKIQEQVKEHYFINFWQELRLEEIVSTIISSNIFAFAAQTSKEDSIKIAQKIVGLYPSGKIDNDLINELNKVSQMSFDTKFKKMTIDFFDKVV